MCFVRVSKQTAITFLYSISRLVFVTEMESVYCAVRTGSLYIKQICFVFKGLINNYARCEYYKASELPYNCVHTLIYFVYLMLACQAETCC
jgi:hypothetical protein